MHAKLGSSTILSLDLRMPAQGAWIADVVSDSDISLTGLVELTIGDGIANLLGSVERGESFHGRFSARIVAGQGKLGKVLEPKAYANSPMLLPLREAVEVAGENLDTTMNSAPMLLNNVSRWVIRNDKLGAIIDEIAEELGATWRLTSAGKIWLGVDTFPALGATVTPMEELPTNNGQILACEDALVVPGVSILGRSVVSVTHSLSGNIWRSTVFYG